MRQTLRRNFAMRSIRVFSRQFARDEAGAVAVIAAIVFPVVVGAMGLGAETGYWYFKQRELQHAADVAAHAAAVRYRAGDGLSSLDAAATTVAVASGFSSSSGELDVSTEAGSPGGKVTVVLSESRPRLFSSVFSPDPIILSARAVAQVAGGSKACVLALSTSASGAVTVTGSTEVQLSGCSVVSNSTASDAFLMRNGSAMMSTDCVYTVGGAVTTSGLTLSGCDAPVERVPPTADPFASVTEPDNMQIQQLPCRSLEYISNATYTFDRLPSGQEAIRFCGGLDIKGNVTLKSGLYILDGGDFTVTAGANLSGSGVTLLLVNGAAVKLTGNGNIDLSAPTSGPYAGLLFFGSRKTTGLVHEITGNTESTFQGNIYMPTGQVAFTGNSSVSGGCTQIVADQVVFTGNSAMETCALSSDEIMVGQTVALIE